MCAGVGALQFDPPMIFDIGQVPPLDLSTYIVGTHRRGHPAAKPEGGSLVKPLMGV